MKPGNTSVSAPDAPAPQQAPRWPLEAWRLGLISGASVAALCLAYLVVLVIGLATLPSPDHPVQQPWFALLELLILFIAPAMVALAVAICCSAAPGRLPLALVGLVFFGLCALTTSAVHFCILVLGGHDAFAGEPWSTLVFSFRWPSVAYALDILAWDVFFPLGALFLAPAVQGAGLASRVRALLVISAVLALAGLAGVVLGDMQVRAIGVVGYAMCFPVAAAMLALRFHREGRSVAG
jgi:GNAT superfamily N-acetyltransferase